MQTVVRAIDEAPAVCRLVDRQAEAGVEFGEVADLELDRSEIRIDISEVVVQVGALAVDRAVLIDRDVRQSREHRRVVDRGDRQRERTRQRDRAGIVAGLDLDGHRAVVIECGVHVDRVVGAVGEAVAVCGHAD